MNTATLQQAFEACQANKSAWLDRKAELAATEQEYREQVVAGNEQSARRMQELRDITEVKKWEINQAAGRYIRSHEEVQHGAELTAVLAPELMGISSQPALIKNRALDRSAEYLREALSSWLTGGAKINYSSQNSDILTAIGFRPDAALRVDYQVKYTPAQSMIYSRKCAELAAEQPV